MLQQEQILRGMDLLRKQVGKKYVFGTEVAMSDPNPNQFDCSELVEWLFKQLGYVVPDGSYNQYDASQEVVDPKPLDLGFYMKDGKVFHVGIRYDDNWVIHAKNTMEGVVKETVTLFEGHKCFVGWRRLTCLIK